MANMENINRVKVIAYYLPQFHPIPENNEWWGNGFTEWTVTAKAKPLFKNHYQPKIPKDLGFYDLRLPESREAQAKLAEEAGISAFCYWHYWFGNNKRLLNFPFDEVVRIKEPKFPFCLAWANHSWYKKSWSPAKGHFSNIKSKLLIEQTYPGIKDYDNHFYTMLSAFQDNRYFRIKERLVFVIFNPCTFPDCIFFMNRWQDLAIRNNLPGFYFIAYTYKIEELDKLKHLKFDAVNLCMHHEVFPNSNINTSIIHRYINIFNSIFSLKPRILSYKKAIERMDTELNEEEKIYPSIIPNWDHTPRSGNFGRVFTDCTPELFKIHVLQTLERIKNKDEDDKIVFLKSWNEWGEGNYLEPDLRYGREFINALKEALSKT